MQLTVRLTYEGPRAKLMLHLAGSLLSPDERYMRWMGSDNGTKGVVVFRWRCISFPPGTARDRKERPILKSLPTIALWAYDDSDQRNKLFRVDLTIPRQAAGLKRFNLRRPLRKGVSSAWPEGRQVRLRGTVANEGLLFLLYPQRRGGMHRPRRIHQQRASVVHRNVARVTNTATPDALYWATDDRSRDTDQSGHGRATLRASMLDMNMDTGLLGAGKRGGRLSLSPARIAHWTRVFEDILADMQTHRRLLAPRRPVSNHPAASHIDPATDWLELVTWVVTRTHTYRGDVYSADYRTSHGTNAGDVGMAGGTGDCEDLVIGAGELLPIFRVLDFDDAGRPSHAILKEMVQASLLYAIGLLLCRVQGIKHDDNATLGSVAGKPVFHVVVGAIPHRYFGSTGGSRGLPVLLLEATNIVTTHPRSWIDVHQIPKRQTHKLATLLRQMHSMSGSQYYLRFLQFYTLDALRRTRGAEGFDLVSLASRSVPVQRPSGGIGALLNGLLGGPQRSGGRRRSKGLQGVSKTDYFAGRFELVPQPPGGVDYASLAREEASHKFDGFDWPEDPTVGAARRALVPEAIRTLAHGGVSESVPPTPPGRPYCVGWMPLDRYFADRVRDVSEHYTIVFYPQAHLDAVLVALWMRKVKISKRTYA